MNKNGSLTPSPSLHTPSRSTSTQFQESSNES